MVKYIYHRILQSIPLIIIVMIFSFFVIHIMPGDPVRTMLGDRATEEQISIMNERLNLDKPITEQFVIWIKKVVKLDFGESICWSEPVLDIILKRIEPTFLLAVIGTMISVIIGIPLGVVSAKHHGDHIEKIISLLSLISISIPAFWIAIIMIQMFGVKLQLFPVAGYHNISSYGIGTALNDLILPGIILGIMNSGQIGRMTKSSMLDILKQDYLRTARASGMKENKVIYYFGLKNAMASILVVIGFSFAGLLAGAVVIEQIFNIPGIGNLAITSILKRDYPVIQGILLFIAMIFIIVNMVTDILCVAVNPRIRYEDE